MVHRSQTNPTIAVQTKKKEKNNAVTSKIIKQGVNSDFYINIIREKIFKSPGRLSAEFAHKLTKE